MKSLKLAIIATFVVITMVSAANAGPVQNVKVSKVVYVTLQQATKNLGLVAAIYQQVSIDEILNNPTLIFTANVSYQGFVFVITGTNDQWMLFFKLKNRFPNANRKNGVTTD